MAQGLSTFNGMFGYCALLGSPNAYLLAGTAQGVKSLPDVIGAAAADVTQYFVYNTALVTQSYAAGGAAAAAAGKQLNIQSSLYFKKAASVAAADGKLLHATLAYTATTASLAALQSDADVAAATAVPRMLFDIVLARDEQYCGYLSNVAEISLNSIAAGLGVNPFSAAYQTPKAALSYLPYICVSLLSPPAEAGAGRQLNGGLLNLFLTLGTGARGGFAGAGGIAKGTSVQVATVSDDGASAVSAAAGSLQMLDRTKKALVTKLATGLATASAVVNVPGSGIVSTNHTCLSGRNALNINK